MTLEKAKLWRLKRWVLVRSERREDKKAEHKDFEGCETIPCDTLMVNMCFNYTFIKTIKCTLKANSNANGGLWVIMTCQGRFSDCKRRATLVSTAHGRRGSICVAEGADRNALFSLQFCDESKPSQKKKKKKYVAQSLKNKRFISQDHWAKSHRSAPCRIPFYKLSFRDNKYILNSKGMWVPMWSITRLI